MELLTVKEAAEILKVSQLTITRRLKTNEIAHVKIGRAVRIDIEELKAWIAEQTVGQIRVKEANG